jgi:hypothetical protein
MSRLSRYSRPYKLPLSEREIRRALRLGFGRIYLHHQAYGLEEHAEALFDACLRNLVYDAQCEAPRHAWLLSLVAETQEPELIRRLAEVMPRTKRRQNLHQHRDLCLLLAKRGHDSARSALYDSFSVDRNGEPWGAWEIVELDGAEGLLWLCEKTLSLVSPDELENVVGRLVSIYDLKHEKGVAQAIITQSARLKDLHCLWAPKPKPDVVQHARRAPQHSKKSVKELSVSNLLELIDSSPGPYIQAVSLWRQSASDEQLEDVVTILSQEESEHRIRHLLRVFERRQFPNFENHSDRLLRLAVHDDWHVRHSAHSAFSSVTHARLRALTLYRLQSGDWLSGEMLPLKANLQPGDSAWLAKHLKVDRNAYRHHCLVFDLVKVCEANPWPEMLEVMMFVYSTSPCTSCRRIIYDVMLEAGLVPEWVAVEWPYDVDSVGWD